MTTQVIRPSLLFCSVALAMHPAFALESLTDTSMRGISGQDGIHITSEVDSASIGNIEWQDGGQGAVRLGNATADGTGSDNITINGMNNQPIKTDVKFQMGSDNNGNPGINLDVSVSQFDLKVPKLNVCNSVGNQCNSLGALSVDNAGNSTKLQLITSEGLFSETGTARLNAIIDQMSVGLGHVQGGQTNTLWLGDISANITAEGKLYVNDTEGLRFVGDVDLTGTNPNGNQGLELIVQHQAGTGNKSNFGRIALSGAIEGMDFSMRGVEGTNTDLGFNNGDAGIALRAKGTLSQDSKLTLGGASSTKSAMSLTGWQKLPDADTGFDTGNVYINVISDSADFEQQLQTNSRFDSSNVTGLTSDIVIGMDSTYGTNFRTQDDFLAINPDDTSGQRYLMQQGYVVGSDNQQIVEGQGIRFDNNTKTLVDADGNYVSVKGFMKDGYVAEGNTVNYNNHGAGIYAGGQFQRVYQVDSNGNTSAYQRVVYDSDGTSNNNDRTSRQIYVWRTMNNNTGGQSYPNDYVLNGQGTIVSAAFTSRNQADRFFKAVDIKTGNRRSGNELTSLSNRPTLVNGQDEVYQVDPNTANGDFLVLERHSRNNNGFVIKNSDNFIVTNKKYSINADNQLIVYRTDKDGNYVDASGQPTSQAGAIAKTIQLVAFDSTTVTPLSGDEYVLDLADFEDVNGNIKPASQLPSVISINVRGMSLQQYATQTEFSDINGTTAGDTANWSIAPMVHRLDANVLIYGKQVTAADVVDGYTQAGEAIGYTAAVTTKGSNGSDDFSQAGATQTTGLFLINQDDDGETRYSGIRHLDTLIKAHGELQVNDGGLSLTAKDFLFAFNGELATGLMPTTGGITSFDENTNQYERLLVLQGRLKGDLYAALLPDTGNDKLGFKAKLKLSQLPVWTDNSYVRIIGSEGMGSLTLAGITGELDVNGSLSTQDKRLNVRADITINPDKAVENDLRVRHIGYRSQPLKSNGSPVAGAFDVTRDIRLGEMAMTHNKIYSNISIKGVN